MNNLFVLVRRLTEITSVERLLYTGDVFQLQHLRIDILT